MTKKSKAIIINDVKINPEIIEYLEGILMNAEKIADNCINNYTGLYYLQNMVRTIAYNKARLDYLLEKRIELLNEAEKAKSLDYLNTLKFQIKNCAYKLQNSVDLFCFDSVYAEFAESYDTRLNNFVSDNTNDNIRLSLKTSEEIYDECYKRQKADDMAEIQNDLDVLKAFPHKGGE